MSHCDEDTHGDNTQCSPKILGLIFLKIKDTWRRHIPFLCKISSFGIHIQAFAGSSFSKKLPNIPLFGLALIHQLWLLGSQQHLQSGVLLTSFSTWGTENSLAESNLESTGGDKGLKHFFWGVKNWQTLALLWVGTLSCNKKKSRQQNAAGQTRWMRFRRLSIIRL